MDKYRLELHWKTVEYETEGIAKLVGSYFSGPVLKISNEINEQDEILIDLTKQYSLVFVPNYYIAKVKWNGRKYMDNKILLDGVVVENKHVNSVPKLKDTDYLVIDTSKHEEETHAFYPNYDCYLVNEDGDLYKF